MLCLPEQSLDGLQVILIAVFYLILIAVRHCLFDVSTSGDQNTSHAHHSRFYQGGDKVKTRILSVDVSQQLLEVCI